MFFYDAPVILNDITCNGTEASIVECAQADYGSFTDCANIAVAQCEGKLYTVTLLSCDYGRITISNTQRKSLAMNRTPYG